MCEEYECINIVTEQWTYKAMSPQTRSTVFVSRELHCWQAGINMAITFVYQRYGNMLHAGPNFLLISQACTDGVLQRFTAE